MTDSIENPDNSFLGETIPISHTPEEIIETINPTPLTDLEKLQIEYNQLKERFISSNDQHDSDFFEYQTQVEEKTAELLKSQEINQLKSEFVSILSHDIRNPLNTILLAAGLLQRHNQGQKNDGERD